MIILENQALRASIQPQGAELKSLFSKTTNAELLWNSDPTWWNRSAPVLFPFVGALKNNSYTWQEQTYSCPKHGFARDSNFKVVRHSASEAVFELGDTSETRTIYPFAFRLQLIYRLEGQKLVQTYRVENPAPTDLLFSIGAHPAFRCPLNAGEAYSDYYLEFDQPEHLERWFLQADLFSGQRALTLDNQQKIALSPELFKDDALVFKGYRSGNISLKSARSNYHLRVGVAGFPYVGLWAKPGAPFVCIEPWFGLADNAKASGRLEQKEGIQRLAGGAIFQASFDFELISY